jgi:hypothetical protein
MLPARISSYDHTFFLILPQFQPSLRERRELDAILVFRSRRSRSGS